MSKTLGIIVLTDDSFTTDPVDSGKINDFSIVASHEESLHPWNAIAVSVGGHGILD